MVVFLSALLGVSGYAFVHRREFDMVDMCFVGLGMAVLTILVCIVAFAIKKEIKRLEKLK